MKGNEEALALGRIKRSINSRIRKRLSGEYAKYYFLVDKKSIEALGLLSDDIPYGNVKVILYETKEGKKFADKYGVKPPVVLIKMGEHKFKVARVLYNPREDEYTLLIPR